MRSHCSGADGVVGIAEVFRNAFLEMVPFLTTPSAPSKRLRDFFLMSRPPLQYQEGSGAAQFIHGPYLDRRGKIEHLRKLLG